MSATFRNYGRSESMGALSAACDGGIAATSIVHEWYT
jgi:hypothetical protein